MSYHFTKGEGTWRMQMKLCLFVWVGNTGSSFAFEKKDLAIPPDRNTAKMIK